MLRVLMTWEDFAFGGIPEHVRGLVDQLRVLGVEVIPVTAPQLASQHLPRATITAPVVSPSNDDGTAFGRFLYEQDINMAVLAASTAAESFDLVHAHGLGVAAAGKHLANHHHVPLVFTAHCQLDLLTKNSDEDPGVQTALAAWGRRFWDHTLNSCDQIISVSSALQRSVLEAHGAQLEERMTVIHNAGRLETGLPPDPAHRRAARTGDSLHMVQAARMVPNKRHEITLKAMALVRDIPVRLSFAGQGRLEEALRRKAEEYSIEESVSFLGRLDREEMRSLYQSADVAVHPAVDDPCPLAVCEAIQMGLPVVGADHYGVPELISNGETGLLFEADDAEALADRIRWCYANRGELEAMRRTCWKTGAERYTWRRVAHETRCAYEAARDRFTLRHSSTR